jgi:hypothetical protein
MGLAERVASERAEKTGDTVGYQIRLESKRSANTRLLFCTTGVLLRSSEVPSSLLTFIHFLNISSFPSSSSRFSSLGNYKTIRNFKELVM